MCIRLKVLALSLAVLILPLCGCGSGGVEVRGKVTAKGKTVVWGTVTLIDNAGGYHSGDIDLQGNYSIKNVKPGNVKIAVVSPPPGGRGGAGKQKDAGKIDPDDPRAKFFEGKKMNVDERPLPPEGAWFAIDPKYSDGNTSGLTGEVKGSPATLNIDLP